jgi:hypothetical protein
VSVLQRLRRLDERTGGPGLWRDGETRLAYLRRVSDRIGRRRVGVIGPLAAETVQQAERLAALEQRVAELEQQGGTTVRGAGPA